MTDLPIEVRKAIINGIQSGKDVEIRLAKDEIRVIYVDKKTVRFPSPAN